MGCPSSNPSYENISKIELFTLYHIDMTFLQDQLDCKQFLTTTVDNPLRFHNYKAIVLL